MGNESRLFYYRDQTGQAVGPLPLSEIERFVKAGVLPTDVQVREEGGDEWHTMRTKPSGGQIPVATKVSSKSLQQASLNQTSNPSTKRGSGITSPKIFGESIGGWMGCAAAFIVATVFYLLLLQPILKLMDWLYDKIVGPIF